MKLLYMMPVLLLVCLFDSSAYSLSELVLTDPIKYHSYSIVNSVGKSKVSYEVIKQCSLTKERRCSDYKITRNDTLSGETTFIASYEDIKSFENLLINGTPVEVEGLSLKRWRKSLSLSHEGNELHLDRNYSKESFGEDDLVTVVLSGTEVDTQMKWWGIERQLWSSGTLKARLLELSRGESYEGEPDIIIQYAESQGY